MAMPLAAFLSEIVPAPPTVLKTSQNDNGPSLPPRFNPSSSSSNTLPAPFVLSSLLFWARPPLAPLCARAGCGHSGGAALPLSNPVTFSPAEEWTAAEPERSG